ncbi:Guanine nucleotide-binding protein G(t) subunit alpha-3 [Boothiomyces sp. JEL0838]|nr:Guanine nucleotide-binding protein G(t) subunit alpha-3 [Boothiomyces sp. JEL0838]
MQPKLLILGSSDSGKSTLLKQMKIMHGNGFTDEEKKQAAQGIRDNILTEKEMHIPPTIVDTVAELWKDPAIQETLKKQQVRIPDTTPQYTVLFVMSLASYDQFLAEDSTINMMVDSLVLFEQVINNPILSTPNFVLFFNKKDIYEKKIKVVPLNSFFPEYTDKPHSASKGVTFIKKKFLSQVKGKKSIVCHITCATDTSSMQVVLETMLASILEGNLRDAGVI